MSTTTVTDIPGYVTGTWAVDPAHSEVGFSVRHLMVSKVRGRFGAFSGTITTAPDPLDSAVEATVEVSSVDTGDTQRDGHLRSGDFLDASTYPTIAFHSTQLRPTGGGWVLAGDLSLHGVTRRVELDLELNGFVSDPWGGTRIGLSATGEINRRDFGIEIHMPLEGGGVVVGDRIRLNLEIEAVLRADAA